jgi:hypothetical protein
MLEKRIKRYPGAQPFSDDGISRKLFFGREKESIALTNQILSNRLVVIFARSGIGKTSLINAGVTKNLRKEGFLPLTVRVNDSSGPLRSVYNGVASRCAEHHVEFKEGDTSSLWYYFKTVEFWQDDILLKPILILDQFEELFTLQSEEDRNAFLDQFSYIARGVRPKKSSSEGAPATTIRETVNDLPPSIKIVLSLREDFLACIEEISDRVPDILNQRFRLLPLTRSAASNALAMPAAIKDSMLTTRPFELDSEAKETILDFLESHESSSIRKSNHYIEPFQLQLICQRMEEIAEKKQQTKTQGDVKVTVEEIGKKKILRKILKDFYFRQVKAVPFLQRKGVRKLCSEHLVTPQGRRLRMEESEITRLLGVRSNVLQMLVDRRLLRMDQSIEGNYYELSHDSLIKPVINSRRLWFAFRAGLLFICVVIVLIAAIVYIIMPFATIFSNTNRKEYEWFIWLGSLLMGCLLFGSLPRLWRLFRAMFQRLKI